MKFKLFFFLLCGMLLTAGITAQDVPDWVWKTPMTKVHPTGEYTEKFPVAQDQIQYQNPNTTTRVITQDGLTFVLPPNIRPFPSAATQSEIDAANMKGNDQVMYISWNSWQSPTFFGCGFAYTSNGGTSWNGNVSTYSPNSGDPGPWIWPTGSTWAGRLGLSCIQGAGYSTNGGSSWTFAQNFSGGSSFDKNLSAVDDITGSPFFGRAYTVWTYFSTNRIYISFSTDGGVTWSAGSLVSPVPAGGHHHQGCDVEVGPGGAVYVVWGNCTTNGQNSTEDFLGFARSTNGGVSWATVNDNAVDINGIRAANLFNGIRANGFPRLAIDNTGGPRNGWIYVAIGEKNIAPATDGADMCLARSTDNGTTWTHTRINQDTPGNGKFQYMGDIDVTSNGTVVCSYYDQRNTTSPVTEYWMSTSTNGGTSWTDIAVSDHTFTPSPIPGLAGGYQGDYTGITTANNKVWPFWADNSSGVYQAWTEGITISGGGGGNVNRCLRLPTPGVNTNYVGIPHQSSMVGFNNITIEGWVKVGGATTPNTVLNKGGTSFDYQLGINSSTTGNPFFRAGGTIVICTTATITTGVWTHLAVTSDGSSVKFYKDGTLVGTFATATTLGSSTNEMRIGRGGSDPGSGNIEELRLWSVARTQQQIDSNKCRKWRNTLSSQTGLKAIWHFDSTYTDSVSGYNGTPTSGSVGFDTVSFPVPGANCNLVGIEPVGNIIPQSYSLNQNYPNPFNPSTTIKFGIPKAGFVELKVYDILGREVATLVEDPFEAGVYQVTFDASLLSSGVYFYSLRSGDFTETRKMLLIK
jgi:hypothetical protein